MLSNFKRNDHKWLRETPKDKFYGEIVFSGGGGCIVVKKNFLNTIQIGF